MTVNVPSISGKFTRLPLHNPKSERVNMSTGHLFFSKKPNYEIIVIIIKGLPLFAT